ncbi:MAG: neutral zinc metallopeptidase [Flammeovirgaceae bacterium]
MDKVDDQRGGGCGFGGFPRGLLTKNGLGTIVIVLAISWLTGTNPLSLLKQTDVFSTDQTHYAPVTGTPEEEELIIFVAVLLASTEDVWHQLKSDYRDPKLTIFRGQTTIQLWKCFFMSSETISRDSKHRIYAQHIRAKRALVHKRIFG